MKAENTTANSTKTKLKAKESTTKMKNTQTRCRIKMRHKKTKVKTCTQTYGGVYWCDLPRQRRGVVLPHLCHGARSIHNHKGQGMLPQARPRRDGMLLYTKPSENAERRQKI